jgi:head-tail adaptor
MKAGRLDTKTYFYAKVSTRDDFNASVDTWPTLTLEAWGDVKYAGGDLILSNEEKFYSGILFLTVRYRSVIVESMRVVIDDVWYRITYIEEIGRDEGLKLSLSKINE